MSDPRESLTEEIARLLKDIPNEWRWEQCYELGDGLHWALTDDESETKGRVSDFYSVLECDYPTTMHGTPVNETPVLKFIAAAPRLLRQALDEIARLTKELARAQQLHDATCFTRPRVEQAEAALADLRRQIGEIAGEMQQWPWKRSGYTDDDLSSIGQWADRLSRLASGAPAQEPK